MASGQRCKAWAASKPAIQAAGALRLSVLTWRERVAGSWFWFVLVCLETPVSGLVLLAGVFVFWVRGLLRGGLCV